METLSKLGDPLQKLSEYIYWSIFEAPLDQAFSNGTKDLLKGGRPPFSKLILFKVLIIQSLYNLSDDQLEFQIVDRASFKRFLRYIGIEVPRQRNTREENKHIKKTGAAPQDWKVKPL